MVQAAQTSEAVQRSAQKLGGVFYTPQAVVDALVSWAVSGETTRILDPSFGDGRFLRAGADRLRELGVSNPAERIFGVEINGPPEAVTAFRDEGVPEENLIRDDFFATNLESWDGKRFDAVVGNPPYVRHHLLDAVSRNLAKQHAKRAGVELNERSDSWAYFCVALLDYLEPRGRLGLLLPGAVLHADYALPLLFALSKARGRVQLIRLQKRIFEDAVERTIVLLLDGQLEEAGVEYLEVGDEEELVELLGAARRTAKKPQAGIALSPDHGSTPEVRLRARLSWFLGGKTASLWERITGLAEVDLLRDLVELRIGVVTGANKFFVRSADEIEALGLERGASLPIVSRGGWLKGARWTLAAQRGKDNSRSRLMLIGPDTEISKALKEEIAVGVAEGLHERVHCRKRPHWYCLEDTKVPEMFLPYMGAEAPRLIINLAASLCTNAVHRVYLRPGQSSASGLAAASWTSLYRLSAELVGRSYGGGVLKLELGEAGLLRIPNLSGAAQHLDEIETTRAEHGVTAAQVRADELLLREGLGLSKADVSALRGAAKNLQLRRVHR